LSHGFKSAAFDGLSRPWNVTHGRIRRKLQQG
jgi:hypothetical protein